MRVELNQDYLNNWYAIAFGDDDIEWFDEDEEDEEYEYLDLSSRSQ